MTQLPSLFWEFCVPFCSFANWVFSTTPLALSHHTPYVIVHPTFCSDVRVAPATARDLSSSLLCKSITGYGPLSHSDTAPCYVRLSVQLPNTHLILVRSSALCIQALLTKLTSVTPVANSSVQFPRIFTALINNKAINETHICYSCGQQLCAVSKDFHGTHK